MSIVPSNAYQRNKIQNGLEHQQPDPSVFHYSPCQILKVFDRDSILENEVPSSIMKMYNKYPGYLFAKVLNLPSNEILDIPFKYPSEMIYLIYGNSSMLEGSRAFIEYANGAIKKGSIVFMPKADKIDMSLSKLSNIHDIQGI